ncbi:hypothetical protein KAT72_19840 [Aeromonas popoffii]|jgi:hypothetical protein|uniref:Uncharacterized protein n=1 Tax=Aeromonas popoffii TaxID=70856 RepID=A0ABS5GVM8_9GAMM|nr:hypothetical protein [Aeromonas popoffii]MBR7631203.1 hypothetical protein [Aeromonas popoffii]
MIGMDWAVLDTVYPLVLGLLSLGKKRTVVVNVVRTPSNADIDFSKMNFDKHPAQPP